MGAGLGAASGVGAASGAGAGAWSRIRTDAASGRPALVSPIRISPTYLYTKTVHRRQYFGKVLFKLQHKNKHVHGPWHRCVIKFGACIRLMNSSRASPYHLIVDIPFAPPKMYIHSHMAHRKEVAITYTSTY